MYNAPGIWTGISECEEMLTDRLESEMPKFYIDQDSNVFVKGKSYRGTRGLFELLTRKKVDQSFITNRDLQSIRQV